MSLVELTAVELADGFRAGRYRARDIIHECLAGIERQDGAIGAFLRTDAEGVREQAARLDARRAAGAPVGPLAGVPLALKDILCTAGQPTTCASRMLENYVPPYDATVVARLRAADALLVGRTNLDEFAMGSSTENSALGQTANPWNTALTPGGSSGGSAAAVAARMVPAAIGTDTGGSIRQPAACCGVVGLKPTYGRVSRYGLIAFASSLDQVGPLARTAQDAALLLSVMAGHDPRDATSAPVPVPDYAAAATRPLSGMRLGWVREHFAAGLEAEVEQAVREALRVLQSLGAHITEVSLPRNGYAIATYYVLASCEASSNLARYDGVHFGMRAADDGEHAAAGADENRLVQMYCRTRAEGFGREVKRRIMLGTYALSAGYYEAYYLQALRVRRLIRDDYDRAFRDVELLVGPTMPTPAFLRGEKIDDPLSMYLQDLYTVSTNLAGLPGLSLPCGFTTDGRPIGLHLQAPPFEESRLLAAAARYQEATDWHSRRPPLP